MLYLIASFCIFIILYSFYDLFTNSFLSKRAKTNWTFVIVIIPVVGSLIYFVYKNFYMRK